MTSRKSAIKQDEFLSFARRMRAGGILLHIEEDDGATPQETPKGLLIRQVGGVIESSVFDIHPSGTGYRIYVRITSNLSGLFAISHFGLELPWEDPDFHWLEDPVEYEVNPPMYRFSGKRIYEYSREMVLNHWANVTRTLSRGQSISGYLLAFGGPMPAKTTPGELIPARLKVVDQFDREYFASVSLWVDRSEKVLRPTQAKRQRKRLFESPDPGNAKTPISEDKN